MRRAAIFFAVFTVSFVLRVRAPQQIGPYDDAYHWKRIAYTAAHFPRVLDFDPDRDAWCPWPPLYDLGMSVFGVDRVIWIPPIAFSLFAATLAVTYGWIAGLGVALAPYLIDVSSVAKIDHHWIEPMFVVAILASRKQPLLLAASMTCALFVQPALIIASGATPMFLPATSDATLVPCDAAASSPKSSKQGAIALLLLRQIDAPRGTVSATSNPAMTRDVLFGPPANSSWPANTPVSIT